jgi:hypothetical protein
MVMLHDCTIALIVNTNKIVKTNEDWHLGTNELRFMVEGTYQYREANRLDDQFFLVPLMFDATNRSISSLPIQRETGKWRVVMMEYQ